MSLLNELCPREVVEQCMRQGEPRSSKVRRVRLSAALALVLFDIALARREPARSAGVGQPTE